MPTLFISYAREDADFVHALRANLARQGIDSVGDWSLTTGEPYLERLRELNLGSHALLFVITPDSINSEACRQELAFAVEHGKQILPVLRRDHGDDSQLDSALRAPHWTYLRVGDDLEQGTLQLARAVNTDFSLMEMHARLLLAAQAWEDHARSTSYLLRRDALSSAETWLADASGQLRRLPQPTHLQTELIVASQRARRRGVRDAYAIGSGILLVLTALLIFALIQRSNALDALTGERKAREQAEAEAQAATANLIATRARQASIDSPQVGALLAAEAARRLQAHSQPVTSAVGQTLIDLFTRVSGIGLRGHRVDSLPAGSGDKPGGTLVSAVAISPDSKWIATGDGDGRILLRTSAQPDAWIELRRGTPTSSLDHRQEIQSLQFSADSSRVAASKLGDVRVWNISGPPREIARCAVDNTFVHGVLFAGGGRWLVMTSQAGIRVCDIEAPDKLSPLLAESAGEYRATLASDGELVVSANGRVWHWRDGSLVRKLPGMDGQFFSIAASPKGDRVAVGTVEGKVHVWTIGTGAHDVFEIGGLIGSVAFSPDGTALAAASSNRAVMIWDLTGQNKPLIFKHPDEVTIVAFDPTGQFVATVGRDRLVRLWNTYWDFTPLPIVLDGLTADGENLSFASDGSFFVGSGYEPIARLWRLNGLSPGVQVFQRSRNDGYSSLAASWASLRSAVVMRQTGRTAWSIATKARLGSVASRGEATMAAFATDERHVALAGSGFVDWIDLRDNSSRRLVAPHGLVLTRIAVAPDARLVAAGTRSGPSLVWDVSSDGPPHILTGQTASVIDVAFAPDGKLLASATQEAIRIWSVHDFEATPLRLDAKVIRAFDPNAFGWTHIESIVFLADQKIAATTNIDAIAVWDLDWADLVTRACETAGRSLSVSEIVDQLDGTVASSCAPAPRQR